jgi:hypothetical protein
MLEGMIKYNLLESNLDVAHAFADAAQAEIRMPLESVLGEDHTGDDEYNPTPPAEKFQRRKVGTVHDASIGDIAAAEPGHEYEHAVTSLRQGMARGLVKGKDHFARAVTFVALGTLKGLLPSPYPTAHMLLTDGQHADTPDERERMLGERLQQVVSDVLGPDQALAWSKQGREAYDGEGPKPKTVGEHTRRLKRQESQRIKREKVPEWFLGSRQDWDNRSARSFQQGMAWLLDHDRALEEQGGMEAAFKEVLGDFYGLTEEETAAKIKKDDIRGGLKRKKALTRNPTGLALSEGEDPLTWEQMAYFGVNHNLKVYTGDGYGGQASKEYTTRNPIMDPPRPLPPSLQTLLDKEARNERRSLVARERARLTSGEEIKGR